MIRTSLIKNRRIILLYLTLITIGIISAIIYYYKSGINLNNYIDNIQSNRNIITPNVYHLILCFLIIILDFIYIGPLLSCFNVFLEGFSLGLIFLLLIIKRHLKGLIFGLFILFSRFIYLIIIIILGILSFKYIFDRKEKYLKYLLLTSFGCFINEYILSFLFNKLCLYFSFLIK